MGAGEFDLLSSDGWHSGWWSSEDVLLELQKEAIHQLLHGSNIPNVYGNPGLANDVVHLDGVQWRRCLGVPMCLAFA